MSTYAQQILQNQGRLDPDFIALKKAEILRLLADYNGGLQETDHTRRTTFEFGHSYHRLKKGDKRVEPMPRVLVELLVAAIEVLQPRADHPIPNAKAFKNCIISVYEQGDQLEPHPDINETKPRMFAGGKKGGYYFGEDIISIIIEADDTGRLYFVEPGPKGRGKKDDSEILPVDEQIGTVLLMSGDLRFALNHGVTQLKPDRPRRRISLTFRTVEFTPNN